MSTRTLRSLAYLRSTSGSQYPPIWFPGDRSEVAAIHVHSFLRRCIEEFGQDGPSEISGRQGSPRPNDRNPVSCRSSTKFRLIHDLGGGLQIHAAVVSPPRTSATITAHSVDPETKLTVPSRGSTSQTCSLHSASDSPVPLENSSSPTNRASGTSSPNRDFNWCSASSSAPVTTSPGNLNRTSASRSVSNRGSSVLGDLPKYFADSVHQVAARSCHGGS